MTILTLFEANQISCQCPMIYLTISPYIARMSVGHMIIQKEENMKIKVSEKDELSLAYAIELLAEIDTIMAVDFPLAKSKVLRTAKALEEAVAILRSSQKKS
jgi:hypothetical protein